MIIAKSWLQDESVKVVEILKSKLSWPIEITQMPDEKYLSAEAFADGDIHKVSLSNSSQLLVHYPAQPEKVKLIESMDTLIRVGKDLWPDLILPLALKRALKRKVKTLDLKRSAFIVGEGPEIRPLVMFAAELGFSKITLVSTSLDWLVVEKKYLSRRIVGIQLDTILTSDLTLQAQDTHLLLNVLNLHKNKEYLQDIAYFNFMVAGGVVVDLCSDGPHQTLQEEALKAHMTCIKPLEISLAWWIEAGLKFKSGLPLTKENENSLFEGLYP